MTSTTRWTLEGKLACVLTVTDVRGHTTAYTYEPMDRVATRTDPVGLVEQSEYDGLGNLIPNTDRKGQVVRGPDFANAYDALDCLLSQTSSRPWPIALR